MPQLLSYEPPNVEGSRYCLQQLVTLIIIDKDSPIYNLSRRKVVELLSKSKNTVVTKTTLYRRLTEYGNTGKLPASGDEGVKRGWKEKNIS